MPLLVVVAGPPGSGKTTIATALAERAGLPLIAKDALKETLHDALGGAGRDWSRQLGRATFDLMFELLEELLRNGCSAVAEGNFGRAEPFRALPPARIVQLHVTASPEILRERFAARAERHPVHCDAEAADEVSNQVRAGEWLQLDLPGRLQTIVTDEFPDVLELVERICSESQLESTLRRHRRVRGTEAPVLE